MNCGLYQACASSFSESVIKRKMNYYCEFQQNWKKKSEESYADCKVTQLARKNLSRASLRCPFLVSLISIIDFIRCKN